MLQHKSSCILKLIVHIFLSYFLNSTSSAILNSMAGVIYEEIITKISPRKLSYDVTNLTMKITVACLGILSVILAITIKNLENILEVIILYIKKIIFLIHRN